MEEARIDFLEQIGCSYEKWEKDGIISPVIGIECDYKCPTTFGDVLRIQVDIVEYKRIRLSVSYTMPCGSETNQFWNGQKPRLWR